MRSGRGWTVHLLMVCLLALPLLSVQADEADLQVGSARLDGRTDADGTLSLLHSATRVDEEFVQGVVLTLEAPQVQVTVHNQTKPVLPLPAGEDLALPLGQSQHEEHHELHDVQAWAASVQGVHRLQALASEDPLHVGAGFGAGSLAHAEGVFLTEEGVRQVTAADGSDQGRAGGTWFSTARIDAPHVLAALPEQAHNLSLAGKNFDLELTGFILEGTSQEGRLRIESGTKVWHDEQGVGWFTRLFVRLHVIDGAVGYDASPQARTSWASPALDTSTQDGEVVLEQARGVLAGRQLDRDRVVLQAPQRLGLTAEEDALGTYVHDQPTGEAQLYLPRSWREASTLTALAVLVAAGGLLVVVRVLRRRVTIAAVEEALEQERYPLAARLAGRILAREPDAEAARVARAVALSRAGQARRVVDELRPYLERNAPRDGVLHYVLGLALLETGDERGAGEAFRAAVARTPHLVEEIEPRFLPTASRRPVDAQAYA